MISNTFRPSHRRAAAMLTAVAFLAVILLIAASVLQQVASQQRAANGHQRRLQASFLAESAVERALVKLRQNDDYASEEWQPVVALGQTKQPARVQIAVQRDADKQSALITIKVSYPANAADLTASRVAIERTVSLKARN